jgi:hypothetical protein
MLARATGWQNTVNATFKSEVGDYLSMLTQSNPILQGNPLPLYIARSPSGKDFLHDLKQETADWTSS